MPLQSFPPFPKPKTPFPAELSKFTTMRSGCGSSSSWLSAVGPH